MERMTRLVWLSLILCACVPRPAFHGTGDDAGDAGAIPIDASVIPGDATSGFVNLSLAGSGIGRVMSSPAGIDCPGACSHQFAPTDVITLNAALDPGSTVAAWTGCAANGTTCVVMGNATHAVTAELACTTGSQTFLFNGTTQTFSPASCVTQITIDARGASGGPAAPGSASNGGRVVVAIPVTRGETLGVVVGGAGGTGNSGGAGLGGFNGGGDGTFGKALGGTAGGGGGASDVRRNATRIVVAAGGGGGVQCPGGGTFAGGDGGGVQGAGPNPACTSGALIATGGSQLGGGGGGSTVLGMSGPSPCQGAPGALATGGAGCDREGSGGGGGGGYYGGGGGAWTGGAGGSNLAPAGATLNVTGGNAGNGSVTITW